MAKSPAYRWIVWLRMEEQEMEGKVSVPDDDQAAILARDCVPLASFNERKTNSSYQLCSVKS